MTVLFVQNHCCTGRACDEVPTKFWENLKKYWLIDAASTVLG